MSTTLQRALAEAMAAPKPKKDKSNGNGNGNGNGNNGSQPPPQPQQQLQPPPQPQQQPQPQTLAARLAAMGKNVKTGQDLQAIFSESDGVWKDQAAVAFAFQTAEDVDALGIRKLSATQTPRDAQGKWDSCSWDQKENLIRRWADSGDEIAKRLVNGLDMVSSNRTFRDEWREVVDLFERPCRAVESVHGLKIMLDRLVESKIGGSEEPLICKISNPGPIPPNGIVIEDDKGRTLYFPKHVRIVSYGWPFVLAAEKVARKSEARLRELMAKALPPGLNPRKVSRDEEGTLYVQTGLSHGVLLSCKKNNGVMMAVVTETAGLDISLPSRQVIWMDRYKPNGGWPSSHIPRALKEWEEKVKSIEDAEKAAQLDKIRAVQGMATLPSPSYSDQSLMKMIGGAFGVLVMTHKTFVYDIRKAGPGMMVMAVERTKDGWYLRDVAADDIFGFDRSIIGRKLPLEIKAEKGWPFQMDSSVDLPNAAYHSVKMAIIMLNLRFTREQRSGSNGQPATQTPADSKSK